MLRHITLLTLLTVFLCAAPTSAQEPQYGDYIDLPGSGWPADPAVIEKDGTWYLYPTNSGVSVECWSSTDLETWTYEGVVWGPAPPGSWNDNTVWAPDVFAYEGSYYLYYTAADMIGVAVADNPLGPFVDVYDHPLIGGGYGGVMTKSIDAHMFRDTDGSLYLYATGYLPVSLLRVFPMDDPVTVGGLWQIVLSPKLLSWEFVCEEGPWMILHEGVYYLMYSGNLANWPSYGVGYATADNPLGPFTKYERNPILWFDTDYDFYGPGHHSLTVGPGGDLWMFYHTKVDGEVNWKRRVRKNKVAFTDDGQIYVDLGLGEPPPLDDDTTDDDTIDDDTVDDDTAHDDDTVDDDTADDDTFDNDTTDDDDAGDDDSSTSSKQDNDDDGCGC